ncbi:coatomer subunit epsilon Ecym_7463 [Eremothecium cymbalariae DBVPG|uniref:Coatomer subunit epsilon n=1 Tax=Eremothecium cymbalariae (strain CBS 270.75 / DBVPG 7215 / KCTC 17166 / NRRL Y-17582) TaxID=931890 RepID=G8JWR7_ERECY|nr:hypothetical protein Ecym_7463 [Eremothecium cymbalariae DBVPG\
MDYFSVKHHYHTGNYQKVLQEIAKHQQSSEDETLLYYKNMSLLGLKILENVPEEGGLQAAFSAYSECLESKEIGPLKEVVDGQKSLFAVNLLACAQACLESYEAAWETCTQNLEDLDAVGSAELLLTAVQVALANGQRTQATALFENYSSSHDISNEDDIILSIAESYINFSQSKEASSSNFYFYEELCQSAPSWKTQLGLLNLHLQQGNLPEASNIIELLEDEYYQSMEGAENYKRHLLANKITYAAMNGENGSALREELEQLDADHPLAKANRENNMKFDEIVAKYST